MFLIMGLLSIIGCSSIPKGVTAIRGFDKEKYLGQWYEVARMDFRFERDLINVTATYTLNDDGSIKVLNRGYHVKDKVWKQASGRAKFARTPDVAMLKVSFFGPFYAGYNIIAIDPAYQYALVAGNSREYLWILSRETSIPDEIKQQYLNIANDLGFKTSELIWTEQTSSKQ